MNKTEQLLSQISDIVSDPSRSAQMPIAEVGLGLVLTLLNKNTDYGCSVWKKPRFVSKCDEGDGILVRLGDKVERLETLLSSEASPHVDESIDETLLDNAGYSILLLALKLMKRQEEEVNERRLVKENKGADPDEGVWFTPMGRHDEILHPKDDDGLSDCDMSGCIYEKERERIMSERQQTVCLDFDGVIHSYQSGWQGADVILDPIVPGAVHFIEECFSDPSIALCIYSSRSSQDGGIEAMREYLEAQGVRSAIISCIEFPTHKPPATLYIDDRGFHFQGKFPSLEYIKNFTPWNK